MVLLLATSLVVLSAKRDDPHPPTITKLNAASENAASAATRWWLHSCLAGRSGEKSFGHRPPVLFAFGSVLLSLTDSTISRNVVAGALDQKALELWLSSREHL